MNDDIAHAARLVQNWFMRGRDFADPLDGAEE